MKLHTVSFALASSLLAGCSGSTNIRSTDRQVEKSIATANLASAAMKATPEAASSMAQVISDQQYVDTTPIKVSRANQLPKCNITFSPAKGMTLMETSQYVSKLCGVDVRVTSDALYSGTSAQSMNSSAAISPLPSPQGLPPLPGVGLSPMGTGGSGSYGSSGLGSNDQLVDIRYSGELPGFMDALTARFGLSYRVDQGAIVIFRTETRMFRIYSMPTSLDMTSVFSSGTTSSAGVSGGSSAGGASGGGVSGSTGSSQSTTVGLRTDPAKDLVAAINAMTTSETGKSFYSPSNSTLVVTDTPEVLDRIKTYVASLNEMYSKQVLINVQVLSVTVTDNDSYGLNWTAVYSDLAKNFGFTLSNSYTATTGAVSGAINILSGNSNWSGSQAMVAALSTQGKVRVVSEPSVVTRNLKPAPMQVANQKGFIASSSSTISSGVGGFAQSALTPGTVTTGFNMWALPMVYADSKTIELSLSINMSELVNILRKESGGSAIEVPEIDNKMFSPDVQLRSGDTAVIASFKQSSVDNERSGTGSAYNWLFGGGITGTRKTVYIVIVVTPIVLTDRVPASTLSLSAG